MKQIFKKIIIFILTTEARLVLWKYKPVVIAVSGSVGKTSTKDGIYTILSPFLDIRKNEKSYNGDLGIPLSILGLPNKWSEYRGWIKNCIRGFLLFLLPHTYPKYLVLEVGADKPGEVAYGAKLIRPDFSVITCLPNVPVHVEFFENPDAVNQEDTMLIKYTKKNGVLVLNHDDKNILKITKEAHSQKVYTYGISPDATVSLVSPHVKRNNENLIFDTGVSFQDETVYTSIANVLANTQVLSLLPGVVIGVHLGIPFKSLVSKMEKSEDTKGRLNPLVGINQSLLIDDTYNSSPVAVENALMTLSLIPESKRKIAVLGDMMELGKYTESEHRKVGMYAPRYVDLLVCVGIRSKFTYEEAQKCGIKNARWFETSIQAGEFLKQEIKEGDTILLKGSQSTRMEKAVEMILEDKEHKKDFLVRQDDEWIKR